MSPLNYLKPNESLAEVVAGEPPSTRSFRAQIRIRHRGTRHWIGHRDTRSRIRGRTRSGLSRGGLVP